MFRAIALILLAFLPGAAAGTLVEIRMPIGTISLELYDADKPITVQNFLSYVSSDRYQDSFAHRLDPGFVLQGGGFTLDGSNQIQPVPSFGAIANEYSSGTTYSNSFGTIAMARVGGTVNSATSQWFVNLGNNAGLDSVDGGFTVFGRVTGGFDVLTRLNTTFDDANFSVDGVFDASASLGGTFKELPLLTNDLTRDSIVFTDIVVVPEPSTLALLAFGGFLVLLAGRRTSPTHATHRAHRSR